MPNAASAATAASSEAPGPRAVWKVLRFALVGAIGCVAGAVLGELVLLVFLALANLSGGGPERQIALVIDASGSMDLPSVAGTKLDEVKQAAQRYVERQDLKRTEVAVCSFGSGAAVVASLGSDLPALKTAIAGLYDGGSTRIDLGLNRAAAELLGREQSQGRSDVARAVLLFTDGQPDDQQAALVAAQQCRSQGVTIVAVATGDADVGYLAQVTGDPKLVFPVASGQFDVGFQEAEAALSASLIGSASGGGAFVELLETSLWTALLAVGVSLALIVGQNLYLKRFPLGTRDALVSLAGGGAAGLVGGGMGQALKIALVAPLGELAGGPLGKVVGGLGTLVGWTLLGGLVALGLSLFVPNLARLRAAAGGALGGLVGAIAFLVAGLVVGGVAAAMSLGGFGGYMADAVGRWLGAAILGAAIGAMVALVEAAFRQAWLEVRLGAKEVVHVNLGATPVRIGSDNRACTVYARGARPLALQYKLDDGRVVVTDYATEKSETAAPGDQRTVGHVTVTVRSGTGSGAPVVAGAQPSAAPPPKGVPPARVPAPCGSVPASATGRAPGAPPAPAAPAAAQPPAARPPAPAAPKAAAPAPAPPPGSPPSGAPAASTSPPPAGAAPRVIRPVPPPKKPSP